MEIEMEERDDLITAEEAVEEVVEREEEDVVEEPSGEVEQDESGHDDQDNEVVERAKKYGHLSKEEWVAQGRDPNQWKSPEEFDKTGKILEQLYAMKKKVDQRDREIQALVEYQQRTSQREYEKAKQELQSRLAASKDDMDVEGVAHYTKELTRLEHIEQANQSNNELEQQKIALENFKDRNQHWFNDRNPDLVNRAVAIDNELKHKYPNASYEELAEMIELKMLKEYPDRVLGKARSQQPPALSHSSVNKTVAAKNTVNKTFKGLSQEHRDTYNVYKRINPNITEADFINKLKQDGEI